MKYDQEIAGRIYKYGCYCLCLAEIGNRLVGLTKSGDTKLPLAQIALSYDRLVDSGIITENCYVNDPTRLLAELFPGHKFMVTKVDKNPGDGIIIATNSTHFTIVNDADEVIYDPLGEENTKLWLQRPIHSYRHISLLK